MKRYLPLLLLGITLPPGPAFGQDDAPTPPPSAQVQAPVKVVVPVKNHFPRFDLDFPGGTPKQFVKAVEKAGGKPVNVVVSDENDDVRLPALSVKNVTVPELFQA